MKGTFGDITFYHVLKYGLIFLVSCLNFRLISVEKSQTICIHVCTWKSSPITHHKRVQPYFAATHLYEILLFKRKQWGWGGIRSGCLHESDDGSWSKSICRSIRLTGMKMTTYFSIVASESSSRCCCCSCISVFPQFFYDINFALLENVGAADVFASNAF